jgi:N utilization substance protein A
MAISPFMAAINQLCDEKSLSKDVILETIEAAVAAAYRKDYGKPSQIIKAKMDPDTGEAKFSQAFDVVEEVEDPESQKTLAEAKKIKKKAKIDEQVEIALEPKSDFGRIAAQTAKQVITQRIREAERDMLFAEFKDKEQKLINGTVQQIENNNVIIDLGKINAICPPSDQIPKEKYYSGQRIKVYLKAVEETSRGPKVLVSRADPGLVKGLFENEVPEIAAGSVEIKDIAREAGSRSKVSVWTDQESLDPVGSCVGQRGTRIQAVLAELPEEKIDIILWDKEERQYIMNALSPAKVDKVTLSKKEDKATVYVPEDQLSLAIGTGGQNVRLASKLTGWSIDIEKTPEKKTKTEKEESAEKTTPTKKPARHAQGDAGGKVKKDE